MSQVCAGCQAPSQQNVLALLGSLIDGCSELVEQSMLIEVVGCFGTPLEGSEPWAVLWPQGYFFCMGVLGLSTI